MQDIRAAWKVHSKGQPDAADILLYCVLRAIRGRSNDKRAILTGLLNKCFTPITNPRKLAAGCHPWEGVRNASYHLAANGTVNPLMDCLETDAERTMYRSLLHELLIRKIKPNDGRIVCFIIRTDIGLDVQIKRIIAATIGMTNRASGRGRIGKKKALKEQAVRRITPPAPRVNLAGVRLLLLAAEDAADLAIKAHLFAARNITVGTSGDSVAYTMPIRASVMQRRNMLEGFQRLRLGSPVTIDETIKPVLG